MHQLSHVAQLPPHGVLPLHLHSAHPLASMRRSSMHGDWFHVYNGLLGQVLALDWSQMQARQGVHLNMNQVKYLGMSRE